MVNISFEWSETYSIGHPTIDNQHRKLLELCSRVDRIPGPDAPNYNEKIENLIHFISEYARVHFDTEEKLLKQINYPDRVNHEKEHQTFYAEVSALEQALLNGIIDTEKLKRFLHDWWIGHILHSDMDYKSHLGNQ